MPSDQKPLIVITGAAGTIGSRLAESLSGRYRVIGLDQPGLHGSCPMIAVDLGSDDSVRDALRRLGDQHGTQIAAVVHLAAYFDFSGEENALYQSVNFEGTRRLLRGLQKFEVQRFVFASSMLVHRPGRPGVRIDEETPIQPGWAYPRSKAAAEQVIVEERGEIPVLILRLAGLYDEKHSVPTLAHQIARIYQEGYKSHLHAGDPDAGQAMIHGDDLQRLFLSAIERRASLPPCLALLAGEEEAVSYRRLQDRIGELIHGETHWRTLSVPRPLAKLGARLEVATEPVVPDALDQGEPPFLRPFMIDLAKDHYALDLRRVREHLDWMPQHRILDELPGMIERLRQDPLAWYHDNGVTPPRRLVALDAVTDEVDALRSEHQQRRRRQHADNRWAKFINLALGSWLLVSPPIFAYGSSRTGLASMIGGVLVMLLAFAALSWRATFARWALAAVGLAVMCSPVVLWADSVGALLNPFLVGALVCGFAVALPPMPGVDAAAAVCGPERPQGWHVNPSGWLHRLPVIALAFVGLYVSLYFTAYQLQLIGAVWDPFFAGDPGDPRNGTEEIITSSVSEAWPVPDAGVGAITYALEIIVGLTGATHRWRSQPWLVLLFGVLIVPLGAVSVSFIIIQPLIIGTWSTLALLAAAAMMVQIPYSLDELVATLDLLRRRRRDGDRLLYIFLRGTPDDGRSEQAVDEFDQSARAILREVWRGGVGLPVGLLGCLGVGVWLMSTRVVLGSDGSLANADHLLGSLVLLVTISACAEIGRLLRVLNIPLGLAVLLTPFLLGGSVLQIVSGVLAGLLLIALSIPRGPIHGRYGAAQRLIL